MANSLTGKAVWAVAAIAALGAGGYAASDNLATLLARFSSQSASEVSVVAKRPPQPVRVTRVAFSADDQSESYTGTIRSQQEASLGFRLPGKLVSRMVEVGDRVTVGQVVARLDDTDARLELEAAKADLDAARTDLSRAVADLSRSRGLFAAGHVAQAALDRVTSDAAEAQSRAERAELTRDMAVNRLSYMDLVAEAEGVVTATLAEAGQVVAAGQPVVTVATTDLLDVVFALPEQRRNLLDSAAARAELWGTTHPPYALKLRDISPDVDPVGRTYRVRMTLTTPDAASALGRTVTVQLSTDGGLPAAALPMAAVLNDGAGAAVWRLPQGATLVERVPIELVEVNGQSALLRGELAEGDIVVSLGAQKIDPTRPVRVVETSLAPES
jgi:RND family efflux transporter MFP subunit